MSGDYDIEAAKAVSRVARQSNTRPIVESDNAFSDMTIAVRKPEGGYPPVMPDPQRIDWIKLAADEWARNDEERTLTTDSGLVIPQFTTGSKLRCWLKELGEPAWRLYETPAAAMTRWLAFINNPDQEICVFHEHEFGQAVFFTREAIGHISRFGVTYPDSSQGRTTPGSIWAGECRCAAYGGPCPPAK